MLLLDLAHVANSLTLLSAFLGWPDGSRHLGNCPGNAGRLQIHETDWQNFLHPVSAWCFFFSFFLKAQELSGLQCLDDLGRHKIPSGEMELYFCTF